MAIQKRFIHFKKFSDFNSKKLSANEANTQYTIGVSGAVQNGTPDVLYQSYCWIKDTKQQWTHGQLYDGTDSGAKVYTWNWDGSDSGTLTQEEYDGINEADVVYLSIDGQPGTVIKSYLSSGIQLDFVLIIDLSEYNSGSWATQTIFTINSDKTYSVKYTNVPIPTKTSQLENDSNFVTSDNIKTINGESILGSGDITIEGGSLTESDIAAMGFTKNTGTYSKPSGGIPQRDLSVDVQSALNAANAYLGTVTTVKINGTTKRPVSGVVDLGNVGTYNKPSTGIPKSDLESEVQTSLGKADNSLQVEIFGDMEFITLNGFEGRGAGLLYALPHEATGDEDDVLLSRQTVKTINGESIIGSGNITISGGGSSSGNGAYSEASHGTSDTTLTISPNTFHIWDEVSSLAITLGAETSGVANEYLFQFTSGSTATTLSLPDDIKWTGGETPTIEVNKIYQISILKGLGSVLSWDNNKTLTSNLCTYDGNKTVTFQYPVASDVIVYIGLSMGMAIEVPISVGKTTETFSYFTEPDSIILAINPIRDDTYNYIF